MCNSSDCDSVFDRNFQLKNSTLHVDVLDGVSVPARVSEFGRLPVALGTELTAEKAMCICTPPPV